MSSIAAPFTCDNRVKRAIGVVISTISLTFVYFFTVCSVLIN